METRQCCKCNRTLNLGVGCNDFVVLKPCNCFCCPKCAFVLCGNRKFDNPECPNPKCNCNLSAFVFYESDRAHKHSGHSFEIEQFSPTMTRDPCRFLHDFIHQDIEGRKDKMLLTLSYCDKDQKNQKQVVASMTAAIDKKQGPETDQDKMNLQLIFAFLHDPIMAPHLQVAEKELRPRMTASQFATYCLEEDKSYLLQILYALTTGKTQCYPIKLEKPQYRNDRASFLAVCVAKQLIERANTKKPGPLQLMMGDALQMMNAPKNVVGFLSQFRISESKTTTYTKLRLRSLLQSMNGIKIGPLDAYCVHLDNFGFKGWRGKWSQHTLLQVSVIKKAKLQELGFYKRHEEERLSRERKEIQDLMEECDDDGFEVAKRIVAPTKRDYEILSERVLKTIDSAILYDLPSPNESRYYLHSPDRVYPTRFPSNFGIVLDSGLLGKCMNTGENESLQALFHNRELVDEDPSYNETYYERNDIELDNVLDGDPNGYLIVEKIMKHLESVTKRDDFQYDMDESGGEEPVRFIVAPATADGAPAKRSLDLVADDISKHGYEERTYKLAKVFLSGFHFQMEVLTMRGRLFRDLFSFFGRKWRSSDPAFNWILTIRDPREALKEYREYLLAHYRAAADASGENNAVQVHRYMLKRAVEIPTCMATLLDLRVLQIVFMIQDAEKSGDHGDLPLFLTTMRFAMSLFCITHAVNYCHLVADFLEWHELASDAEKVLFKNFYYTKISPHGKPIWVDRGVEWTVRHIRSFLGHKMRAQNHDGIVSRVVSEIPFRVKAKRDLRYLLGMEESEQYTTEPWNEQTFSLGLAFHTTRVALEDTNFWGPGPLQGELECSRQDTGIFVESTNGKSECLISSTILGGFDIGTKRAIAYYKEHHIDQRHTKTRSEKNVSLKLLPTMHSVRENEIEITRKVRLSCNVEELISLQRNFPVASILRELDYFKTFLYPDIEYKKNQSRRSLLRTLCEYREKYFRQYPDVYASMLESFQSLDESDVCSIQATREEQIKSRIYQLDEDILRIYE